MAFDYSRCSSKVNKLLFDLQSQGKMRTVTPEDVQNIGGKYLHNYPEESTSHSHQSEAEKLTAFSSADFLDGYVNEIACLEALYVVAQT